MKRSKMIGKKTNFIKFMIIFFHFDLKGDFHKTLLGGIFYRTISFIDKACSFN